MTAWWILDANAWLGSANARMISAERYLVFGFREGLEPHQAWARLDGAWSGPYATRRLAEDMARSLNETWLSNV